MLSDAQSISNALASTLGPSSEQYPFLITPAQSNDLTDRRNSKKFDLELTEPSSTVTELG